MSSWKFWGAVAVLVIAMRLFAIWMRRRRAAALRTVAEELGLDYTQIGERSVIQRLAGFDLSAQYRSFGNRPVRNLMTMPQSDREITIFDYGCRKQHSDDSPTTMTVLLLNWEELDLPRFTARPETVIHKLGQLLGGQDIDFSDYPNFSKKYVLSGDDEDAIRRVMSHDVIRALERYAGIGVTGISVEGLGSRLIVYYFLRTVGASGLRDFLTAASEIAEALAKSCVNSNG